MIYYPSSSKRNSPLNRGNDGWVGYPWESSSTVIEERVKSAEDLEKNGDCLC